MESGRNSGNDDAQSKGRPDATNTGRPDEVGSLEQWSTSRLLTTAARLWEREIAKDLHAANLSPSSLTALQALAKTGTTNQARLARHLHITAQSLRRTLNNLEVTGHIENNLEVTGHIEKLPQTIGQRDVSIFLTIAGAQALTLSEATLLNAQVLTPGLSKQDTLCRLQP